VSFIQIKVRETKKGKDLINSHRKKKIKSNRAGRKRYPRIRLLPYSGKFGGRGGGYREDEVQKERGSGNKEKGKDLGKGREGGGSRSKGGLSSEKEKTREPLLVSAGLGAEVSRGGEGQTIMGVGMRGKRNEDGYRRREWEWGEGEGKILSTPKPNQQRRRVRNYQLKPRRCRGLVK